MSRRKHSEEFKREAVRLTHEPGRTLNEIGDQLGIHPSTLRRWRERLRRDGEEPFSETIRPTATDDEVARLRREIARVTEERELLKRAQDFFEKRRSGSLQLSILNEPARVWRQRARARPSSA